MQRHDLLRVEPAAWHALLALHPHLTTLPLVADWAARGWPVIVRRLAPGDPAGATPAALPLPPHHGKRRVAFSIASADGVSAHAPIALAQAAASAPPQWQPTLAALIALGARVGVVPRVFGALLWGHVTGLAYLTERSDLDLLWPMPDAVTTLRVLAELTRLDAVSPVRLDGEILLPGGGGVQWRELAAARATGGAVLVKTMAGVTSCAAADVLRTVAA